MGGRAETQNHRQVAINARWPIQSNRFQGIKLQELTGATLAGKAVLFLLCTKRIICTCSRVVMRGCTMPGLSRYYVIVFKTSVSANWTSHQTRNEPMSEFIRGLKMMSASVWTGSAVWRPQHAGAGSCAAKFPSQLSSLLPVCNRLFATWLSAPLGKDADDYRAALLPAIVVVGTVGAALGFGSAPSSDEQVSCFHIASQSSPLSGGCGESLREEQNLGRQTSKKLGPVCKKAQTCQSRRGYGFSFVQLREERFPPQIISQIMQFLNYQLSSSM